MDMEPFERSIDIAAPIERVWQVTADIERWPQWTPTVNKASVLGEGPISIGSKIFIRQPRLPPAMWVVKELEPGRNVVLRSGMPGLWVTARHWLEPVGRGCKVTLTLQFSGVFGGLLARATRALNIRYLALEADGLKRHCESNPGIDQENLP